MVKIDIIANGIPIYSRNYISMILHINLPFLYEENKLKSIEDISVFKSVQKFCWNIADN